MSPRPARPPASQHAAALTTCRASPLRHHKPHHAEHSHLPALATHATMRTSLRESVGLHERPAWSRATEPAPTATAVVSEPTSEAEPVIPNGGTAPHPNDSVATSKGRAPMMNHWEFGGLVMTTYVAHDTTEPMSESANAATSELKEQSGHAKPHGGVVPRPNNSAVTLRGRTPAGNRCEFEGAVMIADMAHDTTGPASSAAPRATI